MMKNDHPLILLFWPCAFPGPSGPLVDPFWLLKSAFRYRHHSKMKIVVGLRPVNTCSWLETPFKNNVLLGSKLVKTCIWLEASFKNEDFGWSQTSQNLHLAQTFFTSEGFGASQTCQTLRFA